MICPITEIYFFILVIREIDDISRLILKNDSDSVTFFKLSLKTPDWQGIREMGLVLSSRLFKLPNFG